MYAKVAVDFPDKGSGGVFDYLVPDDMEGSLGRGSWVGVPFGRRRVMGIVTETCGTTKYENIKPVLSVSTAMPQVPERLMELAEWVAREYFCGVYDALKAMTPPRKTAGKKKFICLKEIPECKGEEERAVLEEMLSGKKDYGYFLEKFGVSGRDFLERLVREGKAGIYSPAPDFTARRKDVFYFPTAENPVFSRKAFRQHEIFDYICAANAVSRSEIVSVFGSGSSALKTLEEKGLVRKEARDFYPGEIEDIRDFVRTENIKLSVIQKEASAAITGYPGSKFLCGAPGTGKTEVYLDAARTVLESGRGVIILVPEIAMISQVYARAVRRLGIYPGILSSAMGESERWDTWKQILNGRIRIVIGTRNAVFAPVSNLGLIVVEEEHDVSHKQSEPVPRYDARETALQRAELEDALFLGVSASPSVNAYLEIREGRMKEIALPRRGDSTAAEIITVDMREELRHGNRSIFSSRLAEETEKNLAAGEQTVLLIDRKGFSSFVMCRDCGEILRCRDCDISLSAYENSSVLRCNYCGRTFPKPERCPYCGSAYLKFFGAGTGMVAQEARKRWPDAEVSVFDGEAVRNGTYENILRDFYKGSTDILIGTRMAAKGIDSERISLVGFIAADTLLHLPEYNGAERTFQFLLQGAGRAERGEGRNRAVIQTYCPEHHAVHLLGSGSDFYREELDMRRLMEYPPCTVLYRFVFSGKSEKNMENFIKKVEEACRMIPADIISVTGPAPAPVRKAKGRLRYHLLLRTGKSASAHEAVWEFYRMIYPPSSAGRIRMSVDKNPVSVL